MVFAGSVFRSRPFTAKDFYMLLNFTPTPISHVTYQYKVYSWNISHLALRGLLETSGIPAYILSEQQFFISLYIILHDTRSRSVFWHDRYSFCLNLVVASQCGFPSFSNFILICDQAIGLGRDCRLAFLNPRFFICHHNSCLLSPSAPLHGLLIIAYEIQSFGSWCSWFPRSTYLSSSLYKPQSPRPFYIFSSYFPIIYIDLIIRILSTSHSHSYIHTSLHICIHIHNQISTSSSNILSSHYPHLLTSKKLHHHHQPSQIYFQPG